MSTFICKVCGKGHEGVFDPPLDIPTPEQVEKLKADWLAAEEKLNKSPNNEHYEKAHQKAWLAYMGTFRSGVEKIPETLTTKKGKDGFFLLCVEHVEGVNALADEPVV